MIAKLDRVWLNPNTFAPGVAERIGFYVYLLTDPRDNSIFYVGKGAGNRCFDHVAEARRTSADTVGDYSKLARIREIETAGAMVRIEILRHGLNEREAFLVESAAIDLVEDLTNQVAGHDAADRGRMTVADVNSVYGATPVEIDPDHCVVLIRIAETFERGMGDDALYEKTRKWWKVGPGRRRLGTRGAPRWAMAVFRGVVRAVYRIEAWERPSAGIAVNPIDVPRWGFRGARDEGMEAVYLHRDVSRYLTSPNPIRYVNCISDEAMLNSEETSHEQRQPS